MNCLAQAHMALHAKFISLSEQKRSLEEENQRLEQDKINKMAELWSLERTRTSNIDKSRDTASNKLDSIRSVINKLQIYVECLFPLVHCLKFKNAAIGTLTHVIPRYRNQNLDENKN